MLITRPNRLTSAAMIALFCLCLSLFASPFKSKSRLEAENAALLMDGSRTAWELPVYLSAEWSRQRLPVLQSC